MKKLITKDKHVRIDVRQSELKKFVLKQIAVNGNFPRMVQWNASSKLLNVTGSYSKTRISNRCVKTVNKKAFHKISRFSRMVFLKLVKLGQISGIRKASW